MLTSYICYVLSVVGVVSYSNNNKFIHNLVALVIFPGTYQDRNEEENLLWEGGFDVQNARNPVLIDNTVAGSERAGFKTKGEMCLNGAAPNAETAWRGNVAHGALHGVFIFLESQDKCSMVSNFKLYMNFDFGIYLQVNKLLNIFWLLEKVCIVLLQQTKHVKRWLNFRYLI